MMVKAVMTSILTAAMLSKDACGKVSTGNNAKNPSSASKDDIHQRENGKRSQSGYKKFATGMPELCRNSLPPSSGFDSTSPTLI